MIPSSLLLALLSENTSQELHIPILSTKTDPLLGVLYRTFTFVLFNTAAGSERIGDDLKNSLARFFLIELIVETYLRFEERTC